MNNNFIILAKTGNACLIIDFSYAKERIHSFLFYKAMWFKKWYYKMAHLVGPVVRGSFLTKVVLPLIPSALSFVPSGYK